MDDYFLHIKLVLELVDIYCWKPATRSTLVFLTPQRLSHAEGVDLILTDSYTVAGIFPHTKLIKSQSSLWVVSLFHRPTVSHHRWVRSARDVLTQRCPRGQGKASGAS
jgi:hypothetical protein